MALDSDICGGAIKTAIDGMTEEQKRDLDYVWKNLIGIIFTHIKNNAVVTTTVSAGISLTTPDTINGATTGTGSGSGTIS